MSKMLGHDEIEALLGAFALDAVDADEREIVEDHLRECPRCRAEVEQHREVAAHLAFAGSSAPEGLWTRIAAELEPAESEPDLARIYPLRSASPTRSGLYQVLTGAVAAALIAVMGVLGWQVHTEQTRVRHLAAALVQAGGLNGAVRDASLDPSSAKFALTSADGKVHVDAVMQPDGTGYLVSHGSLATLPKGETYQLWGVVGGQRISLGLLGTDPDVVAFRAAGTSVSAMAITAEAAGGAVQPTRPPVATGLV